MWYVVTAKTIVDDDLDSSPYDDDGNDPRKMQANVVKRIMIIFH